MKTILISLLIAAVGLIIWLFRHQAQLERELGRLRAQMFNTKTISVGYTVTDSDLLNHKPKKLPLVARKILAREMTREIGEYFQHMDREEINGHIRYSYTFHIRQEFKK